MSKVRTRFAPSPTGRMHVEICVQHLYAYFDRKTRGGDFILRIEDTDQERFMEGALDIIYRTLEKRQVSFTMKDRTRMVDMVRMCRAREMLRSVFEVCKAAGRAGRRVLLLL